MIKYEWMSQTSTIKSDNNGGSSWKVLSPPSGEGWILDRTDLRTDTIYVVPKEGWGAPECQTYVTILAVWKRPIPTEK